MAWTEADLARFLAQQQGNASVMGRWRAQEGQEGRESPRQGQEASQHVKAKRDASVALETAWGDKPRYKSKTEARFVQEIAEPLLYEGKIKAWFFEPCKGLYLCARTSYTPDFLLWMAAGQQVFVEVKGALIRAKDWEKTKFAAKCYPCWQFELWQWKGGHWRCKQVPNF